MGGFQSTNQESAGTSDGSAPLNPASDSAWVTFFLCLAEEMRYHKFRMEGGRQQQLLHCITQLCISLPVRLMKQVAMVTIVGI
jgi:hypothetical protein